MKKNILVCTLVAIASFSAGYFTHQKVNSYEFIKEANDFKAELIDAYDVALLKADKVMDNNGLWDKDGSDDMADYMEYHAKIDSLYSTQL